MRFGRAFVRACLLSWSVGLPEAARGDVPSSPAPATPTVALEPAWVWATETSSPRATDAANLTDRESELLSRCGRGDEGLRAVARRLVDRRLRGLPYLDADGLAQALRVAGEPHVWPRAWVVSGRALDHDATREKLTAWAATFREPGERRCGVATGFGADGTEVVAALAVDAQGDLGPIPVQTRVGAWLTVDARLLVPARDAHIVLMGPSGPPRTVPTQFARAQGRVRARLALDSPGGFTVQVVADLASGPRPVLEAAVFADVRPWSSLPDLSVPGETATNGDGAAAHDLEAKVAALRAIEHLPLLRTDRRLEALALAHARRMMQAGVVAHDAGDGDPAHRFDAASIAAREIGENVAHAASLVLAHRSLYASPSHRTNLLAPGFDRIGTAVLPDADGSVWVVEEFLGSP